MRAVQLAAFGEPLVPVDLELPELGEGQVLVRVLASGVNPLDVKIAAGAAPHARVEPPHVLGIDLAGEVVTAAGGFAAGERVHGMTGGVGSLPGSLAEYVAVDADLLAPAPATLTPREAAALPLAAVTAWTALVDHARVGPGTHVLVHGGAGGVGHVAVQLAVARGARVAATGRGADLDLIAGYGAEPIDRTAVPPEKYVEALTGGEGFDVVLDTVAGKVLDDSFRSVRADTGHVVSILGWGTHDLAPLSFRGGTYSGVFALKPLLDGRDRAHHGRVLRQVAALVDAGRLRPRLHPDRLGLDDVAQAHALVGSGAARGKVVIDVAADRTADRTAGGAQGAGGGPRISIP